MSKSDRKWTAWVFVGCGLFCVLLSMKWNFWWAVANFQFGIAYALLINWRWE